MRVVQVLKHPIVLSQNRQKSANQITISEQTKYAPHIKTDSERYLTSEAENRLPVRIEAGEKNFQRR